MALTNVSWDDSAFRIAAAMALCWAAQIVFTSLFIRAGYPKSTKKAFLLKMCASSLFVLNGALAYRLADAPGAYGKWVLAGLVCGWIGDIFLTIHPFLPPDAGQKTMFIVMVPGGIAFLLGHAAYVVALTRLSGVSAFSLPLFFGVWAVLMAVIAALYRLLRLDAGRFLVPITIYALALTAMASFACTIALRGYSNPAARAVLIAAPLLFITSDCTLAARSFCKDRFRSIGVRILYLGTYFAAQMLFGLSVLMVR